MATILITGGTGMVGTRLREILRKAGHQSLILTRDEGIASTHDDHLHWDASQGLISDRITEADHVINLAGAGIADERWTDKRKQLIMQSRTLTTRFLIQQFRKRNHRLSSFISASAIGYYGDGGETLLTEGTGIQTHEFLSEVCMAWEEEAKEAEDIADRLAIIRISTVLAEKGGALEKMDMTIPYGVANYLGSGKQWFSWIHIDDLCRIFLIAIEDQDFSGTYNAAAPELLTNKQFTAKLRDVINKKALLLPAPAFGIKLTFGEMARVVLNSSKVSSKKLEHTGFHFIYPTAEEALREIYR